MKEISFYKPTVTAQEVDLITAALYSQDSKNIIERYENAIKDYLGAKH